MLSVQSKFLKHFSLEVNWYATTEEFHDNLNILKVLLFLVVGHFEWKLMFFLLLRIS